MVEIIKSLTFSAGVDADLTLNDNVISKSIAFAGEISLSLTTNVLIEPTIIYPTVQSTLLSILSGDAYSQNLEVTRGNGDFVIVIRKNGSAVSVNPTNNNIYTLGQDLGAGNIVAFVGFSTNFTSSSLTPSTDTYYKAFEFNQTGIQTRYLIPGAAETNGVTDSLLSAPTIQASNLIITDTTNITQVLSVARGNGDFILVLRKNLSAVSVDPTNNNIYTLGQDLGSGNIVAYVGTSTGFTASSLTENTDTYYKAFEYNTNGVLTKYLFTASPSTNLKTFTVKYQAVLNYALLKGYSAPATLLGRISDDTLVTEAALIGLISTSARFYNHHTIGDSDYACIDYINPGDLTNALKVNAPIYAIKGGFTGNGTASYLNYRFIPNAHGGSLFTLNDASIICYTPSNIVAANTLYGSGNATSRIQFIPRYSGNLMYRVANENDFSTTPSTDSSGLWRMKRTTSTSKSVIRNGSNFVTVISTSIALPNENLVGLANNYIGGIGPYFAGRIDNMIIGKGTTVADIEINTMWTNHRTRTALL